MTEADWNHCQDPTPMLDFLWAGGRASDRKLRLFAVACCRRVRRVLADESLRHALEVAERLAEEQSAEAGYEHAREPALTPWEAAVVAALEQGAARAAQGAAHYVAWATGPTLRATELQAQAALLRCVFGPRPLTGLLADTTWLNSHDGLVRKLAGAIYDERRFEDLPILADVVEDAGCTDTDLLGHMRDTGPHVRGCWVLDLILGKL